MLRPLLLLLWLLPQLAAAESVALSVPFGSGHQTIHLLLDRVAVDVDGRRQVRKLARPAVDMADLEHVIAAEAEAAEPMLVWGQDGDLPAHWGDGFLLYLESGSDLDAFCAAAGMVVLRRLHADPPCAIVQRQVDDLPGHLEELRRVATLPGVRAAEPNLSRPLVFKLTPADPLFAEQWHLVDSEAGSLNVQTAWDGGLGSGVVVGIVDQGFELDHPDLAGRFAPTLSWDYNDNDADPVSANNAHGTAVSGLVAASANAVGGVGVAPAASLAALRIGLDGSDTVADLAAAIRHAQMPGSIMVSNNSWGPVDNGTTVSGPATLEADALADGVTSGRNGLGIIYIWAGGNGRSSGDRADYDGYVGSRHTIGVAAINRSVRQANYSDPGNNILITAPGGGRSSGPIDGGLVTTDLVGAGGFSSGDYIPADADIRGTSFSAPVVAGVVALMLEARPDLGWRDVQHILVDSARQIDLAGGGWITNGSGRSFSQAHGFGLVDATAAVTLARTWQRRPAAINRSASGGGAAIGEGFDAAAVSTVTIAGAAGFVIEHVELQVDISHASRGQLDLQLTSPMGTTHVIHGRSGDVTDDLDFTFLFNGFWGEDAPGTWTLRVVDRLTGTTGQLNDWGLTLHGYQGPGTPAVTDVVATELGLGLIHVGDADVELTVTGAGFTAAGPGWSASVVEWNGAALPTTVVSATQLSAIVPASLLGSLATAQIGVVNGVLRGATRPVHVVAQQPLIISDPLAQAEFGTVVAHQLQAVDGLLAAPALNWSVVATDPPMTAQMDGDVLRWDMTTAPPSRNVVLITVRVDDAASASYDEQIQVITITPPTTVGGL